MKRLLLATVIATALTPGCDLVFFGTQYAIEKAAEGSTVSPGR